MLSGTLQKTGQGHYNAYNHPSDVTFLWGSSENTAEQVHLPKWLAVGALVGLVGVGFVAGRVSKKRK